MQRKQCTSWQLAPRYDLGRKALLIRAELSHGNGGVLFFSQARGPLGGARACKVQDDTCWVSARGSSGVAGNVLR